MSESDPKRIMVNVGITGGRVWIGDDVYIEIEPRPTHRCQLRFAIECPKKFYVKWEKSTKREGV